MIQLITMKAKQSPKPNADAALFKKDAIIRARVPASIKERVAAYYRPRLSSEGQVVREAVLDFLSRVEAA